ncbi:phosphatidylserine decarboxylase [Corticibacter populi]|uniref:Phosphatidylserine decarboxylase proenzyme n=1 Tax=Corticibacter populi TaxID=1550736 RepID=A0A3M6QZ42_9BURK|nr:archaetidylserine decarboxylase [Corticibacter populi]RMX08277.1 phosphatidylserine decarboxylase [Corticibacter populi]RZS35556.1 phosphatidylserine decarboxylase [Corticibacter populi]
MSDRLAILLQQLTPRLALTRAAGRLAAARQPWIAQPFMRWFIRRYGVDMSEALHADPADYACFNDFFTRALRPDARPLAGSAWISPVDGAVSQLGRIEAGRIIQAKGRDYTAAELLADAGAAAAYAHGHFATLYLSPRDYHRIHMPCDGRLLRMSHVPGDLYSVNQATARGLDRLFARNERLVCWFEGPQGPFTMVLVGATIVGSIATSWHGVVTPPRTGAIRHWQYGAAGQSAITLRQGEEMGRFQLGSTVILLMPDGVPLQWNPAWHPGGAIRMGEAMAATAPA